MIKDGSQIFGASHNSWRHMATKILVNNESGNGVLPEDNKPLREPMLTYHQ